MYMQDLSHLDVSIYFNTNEFPVPELGIQSRLRFALSQETDRL